MGDQPQKKKRHRPENRVAVRFLQAIDVCFARIYHHVHVRNPCTLPRDGAAILVSNHVSGLDPVVIQSVCPRLITWMMAREYFGNPVLDWVFRTVGVIPVERSGKDLASTRAALRALHDGRVLGVFPEGKLATTNELLPFHVGAALMAIKTGVPVYPVYIDGTQRGQQMLEAFFRRNRCEIAFGTPIAFSKGDASREALEAATETIRMAVVTLQSGQRNHFSSKISENTPSRRGMTSAT